jgi:hypothetical protein
MHAFRERGRSSPRILYWFRTPPHVRVGRAALDENAIRLIEETHPDVVFDWTRILKSAPTPEPPDSRDRRQRRRPKPAGITSPVDAGHRSVTDAERVETVAPPEEPAPELEAETPEGAWDGEVTDQAPPPAAHRVEERVGRTGFDRLRARYAELLARITERVTDPVRLEELRGQAERLNPDTWVTDEEAKRGIEGFDAAYEALRARLGRRRRRRRGGGRRRQDRPGPATPEKSAETPAESTGARTGKPQV